MCSLVSKDLIHIIYDMTLAKALYFTYVLDGEIEDCFLENQFMGLETRKKTRSNVDFLVSGSDIDLQYKTLKELIT